MSEGSLASVDGCMAESFVMASDGEGLLADGGSVVISGSVLSVVGGVVFSPAQFNKAVRKTGRENRIKGVDRQLQANPEFFLFATIH